MYQLIPTINPYSYGANALSYQGIYNNHQQSGLGQSNQLLMKFYQSSIQTLILLLIQQQLQGLLNVANTNEEQPNEQDQQGENAPPSQHCHCATPVTTNPETVPPPAEDTLQEEQEEDEYALIMENIRQLQQLIAHQNMAESLAGYSNYVSRHQEDQRIINSVQMSGGRIIETTNDFFVAEDENQVRYIIQRS